MIVNNVQVKIYEVYLKGLFIHLYGYFMFFKENVVIDNRAVN